MGLFRLCAPGMKATPRTAADEDGDHAGLAGGQDVIVEAVADVGDLGGGNAGHFDDAFKECRGGLFHAPARGRGDEVGGHTGGGERRLRVPWLVAGNADAIAGGPQGA